MNSVKVLGTGVHGAVHLMIDASGRRYAVKWAREVENGPEQNVLLDIDRLIRLRGVPEIIQVIGVQWNTSAINPTIATIMEVADQNLYEFTLNTPAQIRERLAPVLLNTLLRALTVMASAHISHFDIKPQNVLVMLDGPTFKLTDFGLAQLYFPNEVPTGPLYSLWYRPPEFLAERDRRSFDLSVGDVWAVGVTVLEFIQLRPVLSGRYPRAVLDSLYNKSTTTASSTEELTTQIRTGTVRGSLNTDWEMLRATLVLNPDHRPSAGRLLSLSDTFPITSVTDTARRAHYPGINNILKIGAILNLSKSSILIGLDIYTRYAETTSDLQMIDSIAALSLATVYNENLTLTPERLGFSGHELRTSEAKVLRAIDFKIMSPQLYSVIERSTEVDIYQVDPNSFGESLDRWLR